VSLTESEILAVLDAAAASQDDYPMPWPGLRGSVGHFELHAMRLIAVRSRRGDDWGILFEVVQGDILEGPHEQVRWPATIQQYRYGSRVPSGGRYLEDARPIGMHRVVPEGQDTYVGVEVVGPRGKKRLTLTAALVRRLRPGKAAARVEDWPSVLAIRARLAEDPGTFWTEPRALAKKTLAIPDAVVVVETDAFAHTEGPPSASKTYRSLAKAIVSRNPSVFVPHRANVGFRAGPKTRPERLPS